MDNPREQIDISNISYEKLMNSDESTFLAKSQRINQYKETDFQKCIENILNNNNIRRNYDFFIKYLKYLPESNIEKNKLVMLFGKYKEIFNIYFSKDKENEKIFEDLSEKDVIKRLSEFLKYLLFIYENKEEILCFLVEKIEIFQLNNKTNFIKFFEKLLDKKKIKEINLYDIFISDIEKNKIKFTKKEEIEFYEYLFREYNYYKNNINYMELNDSDLIIISKKELEHLGKFFLLLTIQDNDEVIDEMIKFLFNLYNSNQQLNLLYKQIKEYFSCSPNQDIIRLYEYSIEEFEKDYVLKIKPHRSLCKKAIISLKLADKDKEETILFYGNTTINNIYFYLIKKCESKNAYFDINLKNEKGIITLDNEHSNKTLNDLITKKIELKIVRKEIIPDPLFTNENNQKVLTKKFENLLKEWFRYFSNGRHKMDRKQLANCVNKLTKKKGELFTENSIKIYGFLKKYSDNFEYISEDQFIKFYKDILIKNDKERIPYIWKNIKDMNHRQDLTKFPAEIKNESLPRYFLINETEEYKDLSLMNIFNEKHKYETNEELYNFKSFLATNINLYNKILHNYNSDESMKLSNNFNEFINNLYILIIIESIIEDVEIINNKQINESKIIDEYNLFNEDGDKKTQFFVKFFDYNYSDLIDYASKILEKLNDEKDYDKKKHNLFIRCCSKCLDIINNIYISYYDLKYDSIINKDNIKIIEYKSLKNIMIENDLNTKIQSSSLYENIAIQIMKFIDKYYNEYDNISKEIDIKQPLQNLIKNCYLLLFSLLYNNSDIFKYINNKSKELLDHIIYDLFDFDKNKKNMAYMILLLFNVSKQTEMKLNCEFLSYIIDILFKELEEDINKNRTRMRMHIVYLKNLIEYSAHKEELNKKMTSILKKLIEIFFNKLTSENENSNINDVLSSIIDTILKNEKNILSNYELFGRDELLYYDSFLNKYAIKEEKIMNEKHEKFKKIEQKLESNKENKFISIDEIKSLITDEKKPTTPTPEKNDDKIFELINKYCILFLNSKNVTDKEKINKLVSKLKKVKEKEDEENKDNNKSNNNRSGEKAKKLNKKRIKKKSKYIGIRNLGTLCYLDSVIQQLYMIPQFKYSILDADDKAEQVKSDFLEDDNILHQLQRLFTNLTYTSYGEVIPKDFILSIKDYDGRPISTNQMQDSNEFYSNFCDKIEEKLKDTKYKYLIENLFIGKISNINICSSCKNVTDKTENFKAITLDVKDLNNINESLKKYISEDSIEDYRCSNCNQTVILKKVSYISSLPNILIIHLNRLLINMEDGNLCKINSKFEFPKELNLKDYCIENNIKESNDKYQKKKDEYYKYNLKGVNIHKGSADGGHYISIIKVDTEKWYKFDDNKVNQFDVNNLEEECFGGLDEDKKEKYNSAYLLIYELSKKKPIKVALKENEVEDLKKKDNINVEEFKKDNSEEIDNKYDVTKLNNICDEKELPNKVFHNIDNNDYYKYESYENIPQNICKEYLLQVLKDNKTYDNLYGKKIINFDNSLIKMLLDIINKESINIKEQNFTYNEFSDMINILIDLIISYLSDDNNITNPNEAHIKYINDLITKIFLPIFSTENQSLFNPSHMDMLYQSLHEKLFSFKNIKLMFVNSIKELSKSFYELLFALIKQIKKGQVFKLHESINKIINENSNISKYLYKILHEIILLEDNNDEIENNTSESFMALYYKALKENKDNLKEIYETFIYLIKEKNILSKKDDLLTEIKQQINDLNIKFLFDNSLEILILLIKELQKNDEKYSDSFNTGDIQKLYTYIFKEKDKNVIKEKLIKIMKLIFGILEIMDIYIYNRAKLLLGYPALVFINNKDNYDSKFGVSIMNNSNETQIFKYISYNHIKSERSVFGLLFPSSYGNTEEYLDEKDRNDLIYELIIKCLGINGNNEGNYILFKYIYLMQTRSIKYENLYLEIKEILNKANQNNQNKYNLDKIAEVEKSCIDLINFETSESLKIIKKEGRTNENNEPSPELPKNFESNKSLLTENIYKDFIGYINDIFPHEIGKIEISSIASSKTMTIMRFEYFTTFFTKNELLKLEEEKQKFSYEFIQKERKEEINNDNNENYDRNDELMDLSYFDECKNEKEFIFKIKEILEKTNKVILLNKDILKEKLVKSTLIRYYLLSNKKTVGIIEINKGENIDKDVENNYCLPGKIHDYAEENNCKNIFNIYRIKKEFNFLKNENDRFIFKAKNYEKYFKEFLE